MGKPGTQHPHKPLCGVCDTPIPDDWAARGYDTHIGCDPTTGSYPEPHPEAS